VIGNIFKHLTRHFLSDEEIISRFALSRKTIPVSKHRNQRNMTRGRCVIAENSSFMKRMRVVDGFVFVKPLTPARRRAHWHAKMRQRWADISKLVTDLEKDRERRRLMRYAA
jgi:hypothetical protein